MVNRQPPLRQRRFGHCVHCSPATGCELEASTPEAVDRIQWQKRAPAPAEEPDENARYEAHKQRQAGYQRAISAAGREIGAIPAIVDPERRARAKDDLKFHLLTYHQRAFRLGFSHDHEETDRSFAARHDPRRETCDRNARGTGKTTVVTRAMGWGILHGHLRYGVFLAATDQKAQKGILQLRREIENGEMLIEDFRRPAIRSAVFEASRIVRPARPVAASRRGWNGAP